MASLFPEPDNEDDTYLVGSSVGLIEVKALEIIELTLKLLLICQGHSLRRSKQVAQLRSCGVQKQRVHLSQNAGGAGTRESPSLKTHSQSS